MGTITAAVATVHTPHLLSHADAVPDETNTWMRDGFTTLGEQVLASGADVLIAFSSEHVVNLSPRMAAPFVVGIGARHRIFAEPHFLLPEGWVDNDADLARALVEATAAEGVDVAHSVDLGLDHGTMMPLHLMGVLGKLPVMVIMVNSLFPPLPPLARCYALGSAVGRFVRSDRCGARVALLATGGLSHSVGEPRMGDVDEEFDRAFLDAIVRGADDELLAVPAARLERAGNGTAEIRNWLAVRGAVPDWDAGIVISRSDVPGWWMGVHQVAWSPPGSARQE